MTTGRHSGDATDPTASSREPVDPTVPVAVPGDQAEVVRHEERLHAGTEVHEAGRVRVSKHVETYPVEETVARDVEHADTSERTPAEEDDDGQVRTLPDGSVSIPVFEEVLVVTKKLVVRERVVVRKHTVVDEHVLQTELRREHVTVEGVGDIEVEERTRASGGVGAPPDRSEVDPSG